MSGQPIRDMNSLLRTAVTHSAIGDASTASSDRPVGPIDQQRRQWLSQAISAATTSVTDTLARNIAHLRQFAACSALEEGVERERGSEDTAVTADEAQRALDQILDLVDNIDIANDFLKMGGFEVLKPLLTSQIDGMRWRSADLVAELVQNNPVCQRGATVQCRLVPTLLVLADKDDNIDVRIKAFYALSGLIRDNPTAQNELSRLDGFSVLLRAMQTNVDKIKTKSALMLRSLCLERPELRRELVEMGFVQQLVLLVQEDGGESGRLEAHCAWQEHLLGALCALVENNEAAIAECRNPQLQLRSTLEDRIQLIHNKGEYFEEREYCQRLLELCFTEGNQLAVMEEAQR